MFYAKEYKALKSFECFCWGGRWRRGVTTNVYQFFYLFRILTKTLVAFVFTLARQCTKESINQII